MANVVVIEDEASVRRIIRRVLDRESHNVREVATGSEAIRICKQDGIDLLICDIGLPEINGYEVALQCRGTCPDCGVILMSGHLPDELERRRIPEDIKYLQKPFSPADLMQAVNAALTNSKGS